MASSSALLTTERDMISVRVRCAVGRDCRRRPPPSLTGESFPRVYWVAVPKALCARRVNSELADGWITMRPRVWRCIDEIYAGVFDGACGGRGRLFHSVPATPPLPITYPPHCRRCRAFDFGGCPGSGGVVSGVCGGTGMSYEEIAQRYPEEFKMRAANKLTYRYPRGARRHHAHSRAR
jgi:hypothetical protein